MHVEYYMVRKSWGFFFICFVLYTFCVRLCTSIFFEPSSCQHTFIAAPNLCVCVTQIKITAFLICSVYIFSLNLCKVIFGKGPLNMICIWVEKSSVRLDTELYLLSKEMLKPYAYFPFFFLIGFCLIN